jgi:hypothetical protein
MKRWWMSFCDARRPQGEQFLGVCIVRAHNEAEATRVAWQLGINPGGEIMFMAIDEEQAGRLSFALPEDVLVAGAEGKALADRVAGELAS